jgi:hypothetical protein
MARFMNGLNHDITHIVELHHYVKLEEMVHMIVNVGKQLKWKGNIWQKQPLGPLKPWKPNWKANTRVVHHKIMRRARLNTLKRRKTPWSLLKVTILLLRFVTVTLNAFVVWVLVMLLHSVQTKKSWLWKLIIRLRLMRRMKRRRYNYWRMLNVDDVCVEYPIKRQTLMVRRTLNMYVKVDDLEGQRQNIFHTRCHDHNKVYNLIIDGGNCTNIASTKLVKKLNLYTTKHLILYKL